LTAAPSEIDPTQAAAWMGTCLDLARQAAREGHYALGALVVRDGEVLARSASRLIGAHDPSAHPELCAVRAAAERERSRYLPGAFLVTTLEPCVMCTGSAIWAKMAGIVFGASQDDAVAWARAHPDPVFTWRQIRLRSQVVVDHGEPRLALLGGVRRDECVALFELPSRYAGRGDDVGGG
jgi:tRNA(adenine34) deaminase